MTNLAKHQIIDHQTENMIDFTQNFMHYASTNHKVVFENDRNIQADLTELIQDLQFGFFQQDSYS
jgi:hypothetical protein